MARRKASLTFCEVCRDHPVSHGPRCQWCNLLLDGGSRHAPNRLTDDQIAEHYRFYARRVLHAEGRYPDGSDDDLSADEPLPLLPDTEATAQVTHLEAFEFLGSRSGVIRAQERFKCADCGVRPADRGALCGLCANKLPEAERPAPNEATTPLLLAHYSHYAQVMWSAFVRLGAAIADFDAGQISAREHEAACVQLGPIWGICANALLNVRTSHLEHNRVPADGRRSAAPGWVILFFRCTKCGVTYELPEAVFEELKPESERDLEEKIALLELCPPCFVDETGVGVWWG